MMEWPQEPIFTKVRGDGTVTHNYAVPPQWELMPAVAHVSASLQCDYCFDDPLLKMAKDGLPTGFTPTTVYLDSDGEIHAPPPPQHQRFFAAPRERDPEEVAREVLGSIIGFLEKHAPQVDEKDEEDEEDEGWFEFERVVKKRARAIRNGAVVVKGEGGCPVRVAHLRRYFMSGDFLPFLNECTVRDECAGMPNVFVDIENDRNHKFLGGLIDAHQKNLIRVVAVTQAAAQAFPTPAEPEVRVGRFFKRCSAPPLYARKLSAPIVSHGAACVVLERIYRREVGFWHMCDAQRVDDAFKYISEDTQGQLWDAHCKDLRRHFRAWNRMRWGERKKAVDFMRTKLESRWVELARKKTQDFLWMRRRYWAEQTPRPTKGCSPESLNFAQICVTKERLYPLKQVNPDVSSVLVTDCASKYTAEELDCFTERLHCHLFSPPSLKKKRDDRMGLAARLVLGMRSLYNPASCWIEFTTAPPFAQKCLTRMQEYCQAKAEEFEEEIQEYKEKEEDYGREIRECKRRVREWERKVAEYIALARWKILPDEWETFEPSVPLRGDETIEIVERDNVLVARFESRPAKRQKKRK